MCETTCRDRSLSPCRKGPAKKGEIGAAIWQIAIADATDRLYLLPRSGTTPTDRLHLLPTLDYAYSRTLVQMRVLAALAALALAATAAAFDNGAAHSRLPPLGWSSWDALAAGADHPIRDFCDTVSVKAAADAYIETGLYDAGYRHLHLDDCWAGRQRNASGFIQPDPARFPGGMKEVVDYVHSKGLTFGLYTSAGKTVCVGGRVGSQGHWKDDALVFASWAVDWVKMDWCGGATDVKGSYVAMSKALNESGRRIALNMCRGDEKPWSWIFPLAQSWRVTEDHSGTWTQPSHGIKQGIETAMTIPREATGKPYGWNDLDMLQTGTGPASGYVLSSLLSSLLSPLLTSARRRYDPTLGPPNVTLDESVTEFSMWAILASPMLFTTPIMNCTKAPAAAEPAPAPCSVKLLTQLSRVAKCEAGKSFGCDGDQSNKTMWIDAFTKGSSQGCRGIFECDGVSNVRCDKNTPAGGNPRHVCRCSTTLPGPPGPPPSPFGPSSPPMTPKHCVGYLNDVQKMILLNREVIAINQVG